MVDWRRKEENKKKVLKLFETMYDRLLSDEEEGFVAKGSSDTIPLVLDAITKNPLSLEELIPKCSLAWVGYGEETIYDEDFRSTLEADRSIVDVKWDGLESALKIAAKQLLKDEGLEFRAEFYKVLVYTDGSFFTWHRDHKDQENLWATLSVDTEMGDYYEGGIVEFSNAEQYRDVHNTTEYWDSMGKGGNWAAWMTSQFHKVTPVIEGERVVAIFKLYVKPKDYFEKQVHDERIEKDKLEMNHDISLQEVVAWFPDYFESNDLFRLNLVNKKFHGLVQQKLDEKIFYNSQNMEIIKQYLIDGKARQLGFVLQHEYSFNGNEFLPDFRILRGRDRKLYDIMSRFGKVQVKKCYLRTEYANPDEEKEYNYDDSDIMHPNSVRVCIPVDVQNWKIDRFVKELDQNEYRNPRGQKIYYDVPNDLKCAFQSDQVAHYEIHDLQKMTFQCDNDLDFYDFPFRGVSWATPKRIVYNLAKYMQSFSSSYNLWGNDSNFSIYRYHTSVLLVDIMKEEEINYKLQFSDFI